MGFAASLSGLNGASQAIDIIGNNIANSQTIGFKTSKGASPTYWPHRFPADRRPARQVPASASASW